jgi:hypothetical protein
MSLAQIQLPIGTNPYNGKTITFTERKAFGVNIIAAVTRYGKSSLVKSLYTQISKHRPMLIIDYRGEHINSIYPNFSSNHNMTAVRDLKIVENMGFKMSDFNNTSDWASLGFSDRACPLLSELSVRTDIHENVPEKLYEMLIELPSNNKALQEFNNKYTGVGEGFTLQAALNSASVNSIITIFRYAMNGGIFITDEQIERGEKVYIPDFGLFMLKNQRVCVNLKMNELDEGIARAYVGKLLERLSPYLQMIKPLIVMEEADILVPNIDVGFNTPSSLIQVMQYVIKLQKYHPELLLICQDLGRMNTTIVGNSHNKILGQLPDMGYSAMYKEYTSHLRWDIDENYREFVMLRTGDNKSEIFVPFDCPCEC